MEITFVTLEDIIAENEKQSETAQGKEYNRIKNLLDEKQVEEVLDIWVSPRTVRVSIVAEGDWKHTHTRLDRLVESLGYTLTKKVKHGRSDSDWYTATHYFHKKRKGE